MLIPGTVLQRILQVTSLYLAFFLQRKVFCWIGLDWIGLDWIGLDWIGLDWIGLDWMDYNGL
jgi:hypothetical protein